VQLGKHGVSFREWLSMTDLEREAAWLAFEWLAEQLNNETPGD